MRRMAAMVALTCGGLMACGGGGDGSSGEGAGSGGSSGKGADPEEVIPAGDVDPSVCPPVDDVAQRAGEGLVLTYGVEFEDSLDCTYESEDSDLRVMVHCEDEESAEAAAEDLEIRLDAVPGTEPYNGVVGDEGVIQNMELSDPGLNTLGYRTIVRQGARLCQSLWGTDEPRDPDQATGLRELLDHLMVTVVA